MKHLKNKAIFLDRDGTLNYDSGYIYKIEDLIVLEGAKECLRILKDLGYLLIMITNQSGIDKGYYTLKDAKKFNNALERQLEVQFDDVYICPHGPEDNCECRKPDIKNILKAKKKRNLDLEQCYFVGDKESDVQCGKNVGCRTVYIENTIYSCQIDPEYRIKDILELIDIVKNL